VERFAASSGKARTGANGWRRAAPPPSSHAATSWRNLAIDTDIDDELVQRRFNAVFTVEPVEEAA
jgi:hypothetical protein